VCGFHYNATLGGIVGDFGDIFGELIVGIYSEPIVETAFLVVVAEGINNGSVAAAVACGGTICSFDE
jgi:hypothetical protein